MKKMRLTAEDMADLQAGSTINAMAEDGEEIAMSADPINTEWRSATSPDTSTHMRQDADGSPYLGFFDRDTQLGFCWSGDFDQDVEVCHGGMGEPIIATFPLPDIQRAKRTDGDNSLRRTFLAFKRECEMWVGRRDAAGEDAGLGVGHVWTNTKCLAYRTYRGDDCACEGRAVYVEPHGFGEGTHGPYKDEIEASEAMDSLGLTDATHKLVWR